MKTLSKTCGLLSTAALLTIVASHCVAADTPAVTGPGPSQETRVQMAAMHERMAACLRSNKSIADCRSDMLQACRGLMGAQGCSMMGAGTMPGCGRMGARMPRTPPATGATPKQN